MSKRLIKNYPLIISFLFSVWAFCLRFQKYAPISNHDAHKQYNYTLGSLLPVWRNDITYSDLSSFPGYYLLTYPFVQIFEYTNFLVQTPNVLSTIIGFIFLYLICRRYYTTTFGYVVAFAVITFNATMHYHSFAYRPYAILPTVALMTFYIWDTIIRMDTPLKLSHKILIIFFFIFMTILHAFGEVIIILTFLYLVVATSEQYSWKTLFKKHAKFFGLVLLFTFPLWIYYGIGNPLGVSPEGYLFKKRLPSLQIFFYIPNPLFDFIGFLKGVFGNLIGYKPLYFLLFSMVVFFFIPTRDRLKQMGFFLVLVILPIEAICVAAVFKKYWFIQRQFIWIMPLFAFFLGWQWDSFICKYLTRKKQ